MTTSAIPVGSKALPSLDIARTIVWPVLEDRVRALQPDLARVCLHHLGITEANGRGTSKLVRASLMMAAGTGLGIRPEDLATEAAAAELLHNSTLLHDDIIDDDRTRRGRPSAWAAFGLPLAILAGDAMQAAGLQMLLGDQNLQARLQAEAIGLVLAGQAAELTLPSASAPSVDQFEQIATHKTSALLEYCLTAGAVRANAPEATLAALRDAGCHLGIAWQAANDLEDIWADPTVTGKPARGDLSRRNLTLPVLAALAAGDAASARLHQLWQRPDTTTALLEEMAELIERAGGRRAAELRSHHHLDLAVAGVERAGLTAASTDELRTLFQLIVTRSS